MMQHLRSGVSDLVQQELDRVSEEKGAEYHSLHEAYAIMLEEFQEADEELQALKSNNGLLWRAVRKDHTELARAVADHSLQIAVNLACEAIQVAQVARKILHTCDKMIREEVANETTTQKSDCDSVHHRSLTASRAETRKC